MRRERQRFEKVKDATSEWRKVHPKNGMKALSNVTVTNKKDKKDTS